jgi:hypothetical protein
MATFAYTYTAIAHPGPLRISTTSGDANAIRPGAWATLARPQRSICPTGRPGTKTLYQNRCAQSRNPIDMMRHG